MTIEEELEQERRDNYDRAIVTLTERKRAYQLAMGSPAGTVVLNDLMKYCRATTTCVVVGDRDQTLVLEGRREVFLLIQSYLNLMPEEMIDLYLARAQER